MPRSALPRCQFARVNSSQCAMHGILPCGPAMHPKPVPPHAPHLAIVLLLLTAIVLIVTLILQAARWNSQLTRAMRSTRARPQTGGRLGNGTAAACPGRHSHHHPAAHGAEAQDRRQCAVQAGQCTLRTVDVLQTGAMVADPDQQSYSPPRRRQPRHRRLHLGPRHPPRPVGGQTREGSGSCG